MTYALENAERAGMFMAQFFTEKSVPESLRQGRARRNGRLEQGTAREAVHVPPGRSSQPQCRPPVPIQCLKDDRSLKADENWRRDLLTPLVTRSPQPPASW